jgi:hypothetical protein
MAIENVTNLLPNRLKTKMGKHLFPSAGIGWRADGSNADLDLLESHESGEIVERTSVLFEAKLQDLFEIGVEFIKRSALGVRSWDARHDSDVQLCFRVPLNVRRESSQRSPHLPL